MTLNKARILSSENDASVKQEQNSNIEIKIKQPGTQLQPTQLPGTQLPNTQNANFTIPDQHLQSQYQHPINNTVRDTPLVGVEERGITDLGSELESLELKNKFLELIIEMYTDNPLKINSYVVCKSSLLMNMIKLLTNCDKVDIVLDNDEVGCGCGVNTSKLIKIDKILITKDGKTEELKYCYNNIYTEFIKYGISLKYCY